TLAQRARSHLSANIRPAGHILPAEFRELEAADGDITAMSATSISIHAMRWTSFVCIAPVLNGVAGGRTMTIRGGQTGQPMFFGSRGITVGTDSLYVYLDGDQTTRQDDYFVQSKLTAAAGG